MIFPKYLLAISIFLITQFLLTETLFKTNLKQIKEKAKNYYKSKFGKDKTWKFLGYDPAEYPGNNDKFRSENRQKWDEYYDCLRQQDTNIGEHGSVVPEAILGFEGGSVTFECRVCLNPDEKHNTDAIEWDWAKVDSKGLSAIEYTEHMLLSPEDQSLKIYNLNQENTGQYMCRLGDALTAPYFLTVANSSINMSVVHSPKASKGPYPKDVENIYEFDIKLETQWGPWSPCSKCGQVGKKHKLGYCNVVLQSAEQKTALPLSNGTTSTTSPKHKKTKPTKQNQKVTPAHLELLRIFAYGIPCNSHILPESIKNLEQVKKRQNEIMSGLCREECPEEKVFEVKDKDGNVIEKANNSAGIYSMLQGLPPVEPGVERRLQYENWGEHVILSCPGNMNSDAPVTWKIGSKNVVPEILTKESNGRIYVSIMDKIHIGKVKVADSGVYSCWQHNELAGTIRLVVEKKLQMNFNHHIMLFGVVIILSTFLYVFVKAFFGKKYAKIID